MGGVEFAMCMHTRFPRQPQSLQVASRSGVDFSHPPSPVVSRPLITVVRVFSVTSVGPRGRTQVARWRCKDLHLPSKLTKADCSRKSVSGRQGICPEKIRQGYASITHS